MALKRNRDSSAGVKKWCSSEDTKSESCLNENFSTCNINNYRETVRHKVYTTRADKPHLNLLVDTPTAFFLPVIEEGILKC